MMFNNFNCTSCIQAFLEKKTCPLGHTQTHPVQSGTQNKAGSWQAPARACKCTKAVLPPCVWALSEQGAFQCTQTTLSHTINSFDVIQWRSAIKLLLRTRAHKKNKDKTEMSWHLVQKPNVLSCQLPADIARLQPPPSSPESPPQQLAICSHRH